MAAMPGMQHNMPGMQTPAAVPARRPNANSVPGFPQDAYMEGPMMAMDEMVKKPQNYGLRPGWSGFMAGMMTFVRVLPPREIRRSHGADSEGSADDEMPGMHHSR